jgi:hypothetical protein
MSKPVVVLDGARHRQALSTDTPGPIVPIIPIVLPAGTATAGTAPLYFQSGTLLTTPEEGAVEFKDHVFYATTYLVRRSIALVQDVVTADVTVANTTTETAIYTITMAANFPTVGKMCLPILFGIYSTFNGASQFTVTLKHGTTVLLAVQSTAAILAKTNEPWHARFIITFRAVGASGKFVAFGEVDANSTADASTTAEQNIDTTGSNTFTVTITWDTANAGNTLTLTQGYTESLN